MSLDQNLFTLTIGPSEDEQGAVELIDPNTNLHHYRKRFDRSPKAQAYQWNLVEPVSGGLLATVVAPSASSKQKKILLRNPDVEVELNFTGTLTFKWTLEWETHTFEWRRESCFLIRKPDPPVQVAVTREPAGRIKTTQVQLLDYNLNRFDINDRKGLEIVLLAALLTFADSADEIRGGGPVGVSAQTSPPSGNSRQPSTETPNGGPHLPPKSGSEIISSLQSGNTSHSNEVTVGDEGQVDDYANHCVKLLKDNSILYIVLKPHAPENVSKVVAVAEATKRFHYKSGGHDQELHQYVTTEDVKPANKGPRVIKLDDGPKKKEKEYRPPQTITIHLSKIAMPELQPQAKAGKSGTSSPPSGLQAPPSRTGGRTPSPSRPAAPSSPQPAKLGKSHPPPSQPPPQHYYQPTPGPHPGPGGKPPKKDEKDKKKAAPAKHVIPPPPNPYGLPQQYNKNSSGKPSKPPSQPQIPGSYPHTPPSGYYSGGASSSNKPSSGYAPPANAPGQPQPGSLTTALTNGIASVGYSLLDKMTGKTPAPPNK